MVNTMRAKKIKFIDVGQGDCTLLQSVREKDGESLDTYIDAGDGSRDVSDFSDAKCVNIVLTHHHTDHVNGIESLMSKNIGTVYLPFFANEIVLIAKAVTNLKGFQYSESAYKVLQYFRELCQCHDKVKERIDALHGKSKVVFLSEGIKADGDLECLNPSKNLSVLNWIASVDLNTLFEGIDRLFVKHFANQLKEYFEICRRTDIKDSSYNESEPTLDSPFDFWISVPANNEVNRNSSYRLVLSFLIENLQLLSDFNAVPDLETARQIEKNYKKLSHDMCVVLMTQIDDKKVLLTSDASIDVFERLMQQKRNIHSDYMKAPHHGSINNINRGILKAISPEAVIISHGNRKFGRAKDSHPNIETLKLLADMNIQILTTHDVIKGGTIVISKNAQKEFLSRNPIIEIE